MASTPFSVYDILLHTFRTLKRHWLLCVKFFFLCVALGVLGLGVLYLLVYLSGAKELCMTVPLNTGSGACFQKVTYLVKHIQTTMPGMCVVGVILLPVIALYGWISGLHLMFALHDSERPTLGVLLNTTLRQMVRVLGLFVTLLGIYACVGLAFLFAGLLFMLLLALLMPSWLCIGALILGGILGIGLLVYISIRLSFCWALILDTPSSIIESMRISMSLTQGYVLRLFWVYFVAHLIVVGLRLTIVGIPFLCPFLGVLYVHIYRELQRIKEQKNPPAFIQSA